MPIIATSSGTKSFEPVEAGNHPARCISMVHIGTIKENIQGKDKELNKVRLTFELPTETKVFKEGEGEQPYIVSKEYTLSLSDKANLRRDLESWRGKAFTEDEAKNFDICKLLGVPCMLNIIHKVSKSSGNTYAVISSISKMPKGFNCPDQVNPSFEFSVLEFDKAKFDGLPEFIRDMITASKEYKALNLPNHVEAAPADDITSGGDEEELPF
jgi:hypothetical protein